MKAFFLFPLLISAAGVFGQKYYEIDLSRDEHDEQTISLDYEGIKLVNKLSGKPYSVQIEVELLSVAEDKVSQEVFFRNRTCVKSLLTGLSDATDEKAVRDTLNALRAKRNKNADDRACLEAALEVATRQTTETRSFYFELAKNQKIHITITRDGGAKSWKITLRTPREANYLSHFGFTFVPNGNRNSDRYYAKETADGVYTVTAMNENGEPFWKDLSLTANYIIPLTKQVRRVRLGVNGGFGLNGDASFSVMAGGTLLFYDFFSVNVNAGLHNRYKLKGEYAPGQELSENLSVDQLNDYGFRPALMVSLGFRLSKEQMQSPQEEKGEK